MSFESMVGGDGDDDKCAMTMDWQRPPLPVDIDATPLHMLDVENIYFSEPALDYYPTDWSPVNVVAGCTAISACAIDELSLLVSGLLVDDSENGDTGPPRSDIVFFVSPCPVSPLKPMTTMTATISSRRTLSFASPQNETERPHHTAAVTPTGMTTFQNAIQWHNGMPTASSVTQHEYQTLLQTVFNSDDGSGVSLDTVGDTALISQTDLGVDIGSLFQDIEEEVSKVAAEAKVPEVSASTNAASTASATATSASIVVQPDMFEVVKSRKRSSSISRSMVVAPSKKVPSMRKQQQPQVASKSIKKKNVTSSINKAKVKTVSVKVGSSAKTVHVGSVTMPSKGAKTIKGTLAMVGTAVAVAAAAGKTTSFKRVASKGKWPPPPASKKQKFS